MLEQLKIKNIAVIDQADIPFKPGLNILSGETGAGKSIILEAISLLLGSRANSDLIRTDCDEAQVEGLFSLHDLPWMMDRMENLGFETQALRQESNPELLIKRVVSHSGKHRIYINGELATLGILSQLCDGLIDLCSQHEHQSLVKSSVQLELLDRYGGLESMRATFSNTFEHFRNLQQELQLLQATEAERTRQRDYLQFQIEELKQAGLEPGEDAKLAQDKAVLQSSQARLSQTQSIAGILDQEDSGVLVMLKQALNRARALATLDPEAIELRDGLERALAESEEVSHQLVKYQSAIDLDPSRLEQIQDRLGKIAELRRKYGSTIEAMLEQLTVLESEFGQLGGSDTRLRELAPELEKARLLMVEQGKALSNKRKKVSDLFAKTVTAEIKDLKMGDAAFEVELITQADTQLWSTSGAEHIQFQVQTNRGETARPLGRIASGGELSRLLLSIRRTISNKGGIGVYLFDEIDAGMGGQTAFEVGKKLKSVAKHNQVLCITHLPQVAAFADHHLVVEKQSQAKRTLTQVRELGNKERKEELARMLGGPELTAKSLANAQELLGIARTH